jgi:beta-glucosidase/6-phospho-beta-glucosidase/beta-galactosidase
VPDIDAAAAADEGLEVVAHRLRPGLVYVDYPTQRRILKASARWYAGLIRSEAAEVVS